MKPKALRGWSRIDCVSPELQDWDESVDPRRSGYLGSGCFPCDDPLELKVSMRKGFWENDQRNRLPVFSPCVRMVCSHWRPWGPDWAWRR